MTPDDRALVDRFLDMMAAEAGSSRHTLAAYRNDLERAAEAIGPLGEASADDLSKLGAQWAELAPSTVARRSAALRRFFGFLVDDGQTLFCQTLDNKNLLASCLNKQRMKNLLIVEAGLGQQHERVLAVQASFQEIDACIFECGDSIFLG